jgi:Right handed beta helix region
MKMIRRVLTHSRFICLLSLFAFPGVVALLDAAQPPPPEPACPSPTVREGHECVLKQDVVLSSTLILPSQTALNCKKHTITSTSSGTVGDSASRSAPQVAVFLDGAQGNTIQGCDIEGFDHGILVIRSKVPAAVRNDPGALAQMRNRIVHNTIHARFVAINLVSVDNTAVDDNQITWDTQGGAGIYVQRDSDINAITNNIITGDFASNAIGAVNAPGPELPSNPVVNAGVNGGAALFVAQCPGAAPSVLSAVVNGTLYQLTISDSLVPTEDFTSDNLVEGNTISFPSQAASTGINLAISQRSTVRNNTISKAIVSIQLGAQMGPPANQRQFASTCSLDTTRRCLGDADCNIPGVDTAPTKGTCSLPLPTLSLTWMTSDAKIEGNAIHGPFQNVLYTYIGVGLGGPRAIVQDNTIDSPLKAPGVVGILLNGKFAVETSTILRNRVTNISNAIQLNKVYEGQTATSFGAEFSLNDITGYDTAVRTSADYDLPSELSVNGIGNYWGLNCTKPLQGFDPSKVQGPAPGNLVNPAVKDSHAYGEPVSQAKKLPITCALIK